METLQVVETKINFLSQICEFKLSDIELIVIDLTAEYMFIGIVNLISFIFYKKANIYELSEE